MAERKVDPILRNFVCLPVILNMSTMYHKAMTDDKLKVVFKPVSIKNRGKDISFASRTCFHKVARCVYKSLRTIYVSCIYYFVPFTELLTAYFMGFPYSANFGERPPAPPRGFD